MKFDLNKIGKNRGAVRLSDCLRRGVRIYDSDSTLVDESSMSFIKPLGKKFYISFVYEITERVV